MLLIPPLWTWLVACGLVGAMVVGNPVPDRGCVLQENTGPQQTKVLAMLKDLFGETLITESNKKIYYVSVCRRIPLKGSTSLAGAVKFNSNGGHIVLGQIDQADIVVNEKTTVLTYIGSDLNRNLNEECNRNKWKTYLTFICDPYAIDDTLKLVDEDPDQPELCQVKFEITSSKTCQRNSDVALGTPIIHNKYNNLPLVVNGLNVDNTQYKNSSTNNNNQLVSFLAKIIPRPIWIVIGVVLTLFYYTSKIFEYIKTIVNIIKKTRHSNIFSWEFLFNLWDFVWNLTKNPSFINESTPLLAPKKENDTVDIVITTKPEGNTNSDSIDSEKNSQNGIEKVIRSTTVNGAQNKPAGAASIILKIETKDTAQVSGESKIQMDNEELVTKEGKPDGYHIGLDQSELNISPDDKRSGVGVDEKTEEEDKNELIGVDKDGVEIKSPQLYEGKEEKNASQIATGSPAVNVEQNSLASAGTIKNTVDKTDVSGESVIPKKSDVDESKEN